MSPIDDEALDRLADFTAGTLDPTEAARVRALIDTDPAWASAYARLTAAGPRLDALLSGLADPPLPVDVAASLSAAIESAAIERERQPEEPRTATVVPISTHRRWARRSAWAGAAAAVVVAVFAGVLQFTATGSNTSASSAGGAVAPMSGAGADRLAPGALTVLHSGRNYTPSTLRSAGASTLAAMPPGPAASGKLPAAPVPSANANLDTGTEWDNGRLLDAASLSACLAAIVGRYGGTPVVADYAEFESAPALVVVLDEGPGARRVVVAGPGCGLSGRGPDERYTVVE